MSTKALYIIIFTIFASTSVAQNRMLKKFPEGYTPEEVGIKVANRFLSGKHMLHGGKWIHYAEVCTWYGAVRFASESKNKELSRQLQERFDYLCTAEKDFLPIKNHVDLNMFGCLPLELYQITKKKTIPGFGNFLCRYTMGTTCGSLSRRKKVGRQRT